MSARIITVGILGLVIVIGGSLFVLGKALHPIASSPTAEKEQTLTQNVQTKAWIEVLRPHVVAYEKRDGGKSRTVNTGDDAETGNMLETDAAGLAVVHFPDGSLLRLDAATQVVLDQATFDNEDHGLTAQIFLFSGKVWSKVLTLVTPGSLWEVRTSNAVATVRGTAFGVATLKGEVRIIGSENTVSVHAIDPETKEVLKAEALVTPDTFLKINAKDISLMKEQKMVLAAQKATKEILADPWVRNAKAEDKKYDQKIKELREHGLESDALREKIRAEAKKEREKQAPAEQQSETQKQPQKLTIRIPESLDNVFEGKHLRFDAVLTLSDGNTRIVTAEAQWKVIGSIGKMESPGVFVGELGPDVSEFGSASGAVIAVWKDPESGESLLGKSPIFRVDAQVEQNTNTDG